jgi:CBS domain-containing protein
MSATCVKEIMQPEVATLSANDTLDLVDTIMRLGRIRHMPVVSGKRVVGIVSQRDLFLAGVSSALHFRESAERQWLAKIRVGEVMTHPVHTTCPEAPVREAVDLMLAQRIGCLPVVAGDELVGLLSESDCLRLLAQVLAMERARPAG